MINKKNLPVVIGISMPVLLVLFLFAYIYLPIMFLDPKYSFIFSDNSGYYEGYYYQVENGKLTLKERDLKNNYYQRHDNNTKIFFYDANSDSTKEINFDEAVKYKLDANSVSPDGFTANLHDSRDSYIIFFPFFYGSDDYNSGYLTKDGKSKRINLNGYGSYYNRIFLGWVINN